jgi:hypothetical protein
MLRVGRFIFRIGRRFCTQQPKSAQNRNTTTFSATYHQEPRMVRRLPRCCVLHGEVAGRNRRRTLFTPTKGAETVAHTRFRGAVPQTQVQLRTFVCIISLTFRGPWRLMLFSVCKEENQTKTDVRAQNDCIWGVLHTGNLTCLVFVAFCVRCEVYHLKKLVVRGVRPILVA